MTVCFPEYHPDGKAGRYQLQTVVVVNHIIQHTTLSQQFSCWAEQWGFLKTGVPNPGDLVPDNLRWNWCNHDRNKTHNKCDWIIPKPSPTPNTSLWKTCLPQNWSLVPKMLGTTVKRLSQDHSKVCHLDLHFVSQKPENKSSQFQLPALTNLTVSLHQRVQ